MTDENIETVETTDIKDTDDNTSEINDTQIDETENQEIDVETTETEENEESQEEFDPDNLELEDETDYTFEGYDLSKFKDNIDLTNENVRASLENVSKELKEQGFTQQQIEWLMQKEIDAVTNKKETGPTKEQIMEDLKKNLTVQERRDYKVVGNFLKENLKGTELEGYYKEAMANPIVYKFIHTLYNKTLSGKPLSVGTAKDSKETKTQAPTLDDAVAGYTQYLAEHIGDREDRTPVINKYLKTLSKENQIKFKEKFGLN